ncbi:hypothetical protein K458DRAFT_362190 [Lentithecium fluviatile CBS 122367]|uniref:Uncharacterized protein n=1 Tax=Lentithecium fluviatile CBS 122367 TaxID=1168545 RepID=A0A6G1JA68_9PLEO|nr:hypothetical protein K458DRAFT_362190 [Lentithecium fluviatile CBS 122367]
MLSYPDRQKFDQIRSQWEAAQPASETPSTMVGRRDKSIAHPPIPSDSNAGPSKFRRKLSHGLPTSRNRGSQSSTGSPRQRTTPSDTTGTPKSLDPDATPKPLPRSRTMSFIPRPSRSGSASSAVDSEAIDNTAALNVVLDHGARVTPTKIPTPSPPDSKRRRSSPRQYVNTLTAQQAKHVAAGSVFAKALTESPSKGSVRSYTTPNLMKRARSPQPTSFMVPRKLTARNSATGIPVPQKSTMKENANPTSQRYSKRLSQIQESSPNRESLGGSTGTPSRRSSGMNSGTTQSKQSPAAPSTASKRRASRAVTQTPLAAQRALPKKQSPLRLLEERPNQNSSAIAQPRLMGPMNPPTPPTACLAAAQPALPRASTEKDFRRRTFITPSKRNGLGILSRGQVGANNEVRLPRSSTFYSLRQSPPPPMPSIPEQYKSFSMPALYLKDRPLPNVLGSPEPNHNHARYSHEKPALAVHLPASMSTSFIYNCDTGKLQEQPLLKKELSPTFEEAPKVKADAKAHSSGSRSSSDSLMFFSPSTWTLSKKTSRPWPTTGQGVESEDIADAILCDQVKEYMPALYWAGRFQSRFDHWRTAAMKVELDPQHKVPGPLGQYKLSQENAAACQIFLQLRDLCISNQAADSLWEFEYKYRHEHKMLSTAFDLPPLNNRKHGDATPKQGPIGRAVRKLTPRKSSFVNLLKGKGWGTDRENVKMTDGPADSTLPSAKSVASFEGANQ